MESTIASTSSNTTTTTTTTITDILVAFAEQNAFLYFNTHSSIRETIQRRMFLEMYDEANALQLVSDVYVPAVIREFNIKDKEKLHAHNIKTEYHDPIENRLNCRRLSVPLSANKLHAEVRQDIASRLLDWILYECNYIIKEEEEYEATICKRSSWENRGKHYQK